MAIKAIIITKQRIVLIIEMDNVVGNLVSKSKLE